MDRVTAMNKCEKVKDRQNHELAYKEGMFWISGTRCKDIDLDQLVIGIDIEMEHTLSNIFATKIALDHLAEFPDYYTALVEMERVLEEKKRGGY